jgi:hypothetical protein
LAHSKWIGLLFCHPLTMSRRIPSRLLLIGLIAGGVLLSPGFGLAADVETEHAESHGVSISAGPAIPTAKYLTSPFSWR